MGIVSAVRTVRPKTVYIHTFYLAIVIGCGLFVVLTLIAMLAYSGGSYDDRTAVGYSFSHNFFSDLGRLTALSGRPNWVSAGLFFIALSSAGACLVVFFILFPRLFQHTNLQRWLCLLGSVCGVLAGISFIGVAFAPADVALAAHRQFVMWAFRLFPIAVLFYLPAMFLDKDYPRRHTWVFVVFCLLLISYYLLITHGPSFSSPQGLVIQVIGQKAIVYASILGFGLQSLAAHQYLKGRI